MILVLGSTGYVGSAFVRRLQTLGIPHRGLSRREVDYTDFETFRHFLRTHRPTFLINAAGFTGVPNVDACETRQAETLHGNVLFPQMLAHLCHLENIPWGHVSSGCIYNGALVRDSREVVVNLNEPRVRALYDEDPESLEGFAETMPPNFSFRAPPCSFYSGCKALAEEVLAPFENVFIWRLRMPFDAVNHPRNLITKLLKYSKIYDNLNSLSHLGDFVNACLDLWEIKAPFGIYNIVNPGFLTTREVMASITHHLAPGKEIQFFLDEEEFYSKGVKAPRSNCLLDTAKLGQVGVTIRPIQEALEDSLSRWRTE